MRSLVRRLLYWIRSRQRDAALDEELEFHLAMKQEALERDGMTAGDARVAARREIGNMTRAREDARAVWIWPWLGSARQDVSYTVRSLTRQPAFTLTALVVLGVAIGFNASLFTVFAGLAFRPMAGLIDPDRVVIVSSVNPPRIGGTSGLSFPEYAFLAAQSKTFAGLAAAHPMSVRLETGGTGRSTTSYFVTANYFDVLGVRMAHGRGFLPGEDGRGSVQTVAILSDALWRTRFGSDPAVVGRDTRINGIAFTIVGVAPPAFVGPAGAAQRIWLPISAMPLVRPNDGFAAGILDRPQDCCVTVTGRLARDVTDDEARAEVDVLGRRFRASMNLPGRPLVLGGTQFLTGRRAAGTALAILGALFLGVVLVLLIACANVGNLLLARAAARLGEIGVRLSLGADRARIVRQLLTEGFVLALVAGLVGMLMAIWLPPIALRLLSGEARPFDIDVDRWVFLYVLMLAAISCIAFALAPALHATRLDIAAALKDDARLLKSRFPLRSALLAVQVAVSSCCWRALDCCCAA
ncbi:MAG TPA: ABC transporter permease [Vicinamibacterales bacterium]|jgi:predicted permease